MKRYYFFLILLIFSILGVALVLVSTHYGAFLSDDSYYYIKPARDALAGNGFNPSPFFAPLLPAVLTLLGWLGAEPLTAVRFFHALLFGLNILLTGLVARQASMSKLFSGLVALLVLLSDVLLEMYGWAMSEALFQTFVLLAVISAYLYLKRPTPLRLIIAACAAGLACLTRYAGLPVVPALAIALLVYDGTRPILQRVWRGFAYSVISLAPLGAYLVRNILISGRATRYEGFVGASFTKERLIWYLYNTLSWFVPGRFIKGREILAGIVFVLLLSAVVVVTLRARKPADGQHTALSPVILMWIAFIVLDFLMLFLAGGLSGLSADNPRYLAPILWAFLIIAGYVLDRLWHTGNRLIMIGITAFCLLFVFYYGFRAYDYVKTVYRTGLGYSGAGWYTSETVAFIKSHPEVELVSTGDMGIYFWTGRRPASITDFGDAAGLKQHLCETGAYLIIMNTMPTEIYHMNREQTIQGLTLVEKFNDSSMYQCPNP